MAFTSHGRRYRSALGCGVSGRFGSQLWSHFDLRLGLGLIAPAVTESAVVDFQEFTSVLVDRN
jgi:hypothetical protein